MGEGAGGGGHAQTCPEICMCMRFRVSADAHLTQDKSEVSFEERDTVSTSESCLLI